MLSCDIHMLSKVLNSKSYNDISVSGGLLNAIYITPYADKKIYIMMMRRFEFANEILDMLNVQYNEMPVEELFQIDRKSYEKILIMVPSIFVDNIDKLNPQLVYPAFISSVFSIKSIVDDRVVMYGTVGEKDDEYAEKTLSYDQLKLIERIKCKPRRSHHLMIIQLGREEKFTKEDVMRNLHCRMEESLDDKCITEESVDNYLYYSGRSGYRKLVEVLKDFTTLNKTIKSMLSSTLASGSSFAYRREFAEAVNEYNIVDNDVIHQLNSAGNIWRQISRDLFKSIHFGTSISKDTFERINKVENIELNAFSKIYHATGCY